MQIQPFKQMHLNFRLKFQTRMKKWQDHRQFLTTKIRLDDMHAANKYLTSMEFIYIGGK